MAKNTTRKGLALGAAFTLVSSAVVATPAFAAGEVIFAPSAGTTYNVLLASDFVLNAGIDSAYPASNITTLGYKVVNNTNGTVTAVADSGGTDQTLSVAAAATATTSTFTATVGANTLTVSTAATATGSVDVTAFLDANGNDTLDAGEWATTRTLTFVKPSEVTATTTLTAPVLGDGTFTATVSLSGDINLAQVDADEVTVTFKKDGTAIASTDDTADSASGTGDTAYGHTTGAARSNPRAAAYDATAGAIKAVFYAEASDATGADTAYDAYSVAAGTYSAQATVAGAVSGSASIQVASARTVDNWSVKTTASANAKNVTTGAKDISASSSTAGAGTVRSGKDAVVVATIKKDDGTVISGAAVTITATPSGLSDDTVTVNGTAVTSAAKTITATTDANGQVSATIVGAGADDTNTLTLTFGLQGEVSSNYVVTWADAAYYLVNLGNPQDAAVSLVAGGSLAVSYLVADQWGQPISGDYRLSLTRSGDAGRTTSAAWIYTPVLSNGRADFTIVDNGTGASTTGDTVAVAVEKAAVGGGYTSQTITANADDEFVINYVTSIAPTAVTASATDTTPDMTTTAIANYDLRYEAKDAPGYADVTHVYGVVTKADGSVVPGALVTVSANGVLFQPVVANGSGTATEADKVFKTDSITVIANASGQYEVLAYSNKAGKVTVNVASGAGTKTVDLTFNAAAATAGTNLVITAPASAVPGSTLTVKAKLTDKFGNPVQVSTAGDVKVSYVGPGFVVSTLPDTTDANGELSFGVLLGSADSGSAVVTVSYDQSSDGDFTGTATGDLDIVKSATILVGTSEANQGALATWTKNLGDGSVKMYAKNVIGQGKVQFFVNGKEVAWTRATSLTDVDGAALRVVGSANYLVRTVDLAKGKNVLTIVVDGYQMKRVVYSY